MHYQKCSGLRCPAPGDGAARGNWRGRCRGHLVLLAVHAIVALVVGFVDVARLGAPRQQLPHQRLPRRFDPSSLQASTRDWTGEGFVPPMHIPKHGRACSGSIQATLNTRALVARPSGRRKGCSQAAAPPRARAPWCVRTSRTGCPAAQHHRGSVGDIHSSSSAPSVPWLQSHARRVFTSWQRFLTAFQLQWVWVSAF